MVGVLKLADMVVDVNEMVVLVGVGEMVVGSRILLILDRKTPVVKGNAERHKNTTRSLCTRVSLSASLGSSTRRTKSCRI